MKNKGKMIYCKETFQVFPSVKAAAEYHNIGYHSVAKNAEGKTNVAHGKHFVYIENTADLSQLFSDERKQAKEKELMQDKITKLMAAQKDIAKQLAETRKIMKKYM